MIIGVPIDEVIAIYKAHLEEKLNVKLDKEVEILEDGCEVDASEHTVIFSVTKEQT